MIEAIILAAGSSQRMGKDNKLLKPYNGEVIISHVVKQVLLSDIENITVVTGHEDQEVRAQLESLPIKIVYNANYLRGQLWSIKEGLYYISPKASGIMILLGDMPLITKNHINTVIDHFGQLTPMHNRLITRPIRGSSIGHPTIWSSSLKDTIMAYPEDEHLKGLIKQLDNVYKPLEVEDDGYFIDVDTKEDYHDLVVSQNR